MNPYIETATANIGQAVSTGDARILAAAQTYATLALAYEQRTANLIAVFAEGGLDIGADYEAVGESLLERLGLA